MVPTGRASASAKRAVRSWQLVRRCDVPHYRRVGDVPRKRHTLHRHDGGVAFEELMGTEGFSGASTLLYPQRPPSALVLIDPIEMHEPCWNLNQPLRPHHFRTPELAGSGQGEPSDAVRARQPLLGNDDVEISWVAAQATSPLYRDATGDELVYIN